MAENPTLVETPFSAVAVIVTDEYELPWIVARPLVLKTVKTFVLLLVKLTSPGIVGTPDENKLEYWVPSVKRAPIVMNAPPCPMIPFSVDGKLVEMNDVTSTGVGSSRMLS